MQLIFLFQKNLFYMEYEFLIVIYVFIKGRQKILVYMQFEDFIEVFRNKKYIFR